VTIAAKDTDFVGGGQIVGNFKNEPGSNFRRREIKWVVEITGTQGKGDAFTDFGFNGSV